MGIDNPEGDETMESTAIKSTNIQVNSTQENNSTPELSRSAGTDGSPNKESHFEVIDMTAEHKMSQHTNKENQGENKETVNKEKGKKDSMQVQRFQLKTNVG